MQGQSRTESSRKLVEVGTWPLVVIQIPSVNSRMSCKGNARNESHQLSRVLESSGDPRSKDREEQVNATLRKTKLSGAANIDMHVAGDTTTCTSILCSRVARHLAASTGAATCWNGVTVFVERVPKYWTDDCRSRFLERVATVPCGHWTQGEFGHSCVAHISKHASFRFCGRETVQSVDCSICVKCRILRTKSSPFVAAQLRSIVGSLLWIFRQCRLQLSYCLNKLQSVCTVTKHRGSDFRMCTHTYPRSHRWGDRRVHA